MYVLIKKRESLTKCSYHIARVIGENMEKEYYQCSGIESDFLWYDVPFSDVEMTDSNLSLIENRRKHLMKPIEIYT